MTSEEHWPPGATAPVSAAVQSARRFPSRTLKAAQPSSEASVSAHEPPLARSYTARPASTSACTPEHSASLCALSASIKAGAALWHWPSFSTAISPRVLQKSSAVAVLPTLGSDEQAPASAAQASPAYTWHVAPTGLRLEAAHRNASFRANNRVAFNIAASKYRLPGGGEVLGTDRVRATRGHNT